MKASHRFRQTSFRPKENLAIKTNVISANVVVQ